MRGGLFITSKIREQAKSLSLYEQAKLELFLGTILIGIGVGIVGTIAAILLQTYPVLILSVTCIIVSVYALLLTQLLSDYKFAAVFFIFSWFFGLSANLFWFEDAVHFASPFWIIIINILVVYILGIRYSIAMLLLSILVFIYYIEYGIWRNLYRLLENQGEIRIIAYIEVVLAVISLGYLMWLILKNAKKSETELKQQNLQLKQQNDIINARNEEKTVMLKEIHHRVKNNLQVITSLLRLQMNDMELGEYNATITEKFKESIHRIVAMAMIHEKIYQSEQITKINVSNYFEELAQDIARTYSKEKETRLDINCSVENIGMQTIVPIALLINELLTNSFKHAFTETEHPKISIAIKPSNTNQLSISYQDNGNWKTALRKNSLGLELIDSFCEQLDGEKTFQTDPTRYTFLLKNID
jgi:two-component sensor histidine kinase